MHLEIVVPVYNDCQNIKPFVSAIEKLLPRMNEAVEPTLLTCSILFVDDGSKDGSWPEILRFADRDNQSCIGIRGVRLSRNFGKEKALSAGLSAAEGDIFAVMDSDLQHPPEKIPDMLKALLEPSIDIVDGVKLDRGCEKGVHRFFAKTFYKTMSLLTNMEMAGASDFKVFSKKALLAWREMGDNNLFFRGMSAWIGMEHAKVEFDVAERQMGTSKWPVKDLISLATTAITAYSTVPLKVISIVGFSFVLFSILLSLQTLFVYLSGGAVTGFSTVILILLISSGLMMLSLGVIGEYIARIYEETKGRPRYIIRDQV